MESLGSEFNLRKAKEVIPRTLRLVRSQPESEAGLEPMKDFRTHCRTKGRCGLSLSLDSERLGTLL